MPNFLILDGNLTGDPELRYTAKGKANLSFTIATNYVNGDYKEVCFFRCVAWNDAEVHAETLKKGAHVIAHGRMRKEEWDSRDGKKSIDKVIVTVLAPVPKKASSQSRKTRDEDPPPETDDDFPSESVDDEDDIPL